MHNFIKHAVVFLIAGLIIFMPVSSAVLAQEESMHKEEMTTEKMAVDILLVRPVGIAATVVGTALFIVSWPFSALGGNTDEAYQAFMVEPAKFTFKRPLGQF